MKKYIFVSAVNFTLLAATCSASVPQINFEYQCEECRGGFFFEQRVLSHLKKIFKCCKEGNAKKAIKHLLEMKEEMEAQYETKLSFSKAIDEIQIEMKERGASFSKSQLKSIKDFFNGKIRAEGQLDLQVQIGITAACAGLFLVFIPIPICTVIGAELLCFGLGTLTYHQMECFEE